MSCATAANAVGFEYLLEYQNNVEDYLSYATLMAVTATGVCFIVVTFCTS